MREVGRVNFNCQFVYARVFQHFRVEIRILRADEENAEIYYYRYDQNSMAY